jgi:GntR family transcriptional regulator of arabinose operon
MDSHKNTPPDVPKYHQIKQHLKNLIRRGELAPGELIPSENTLAREFKFSRHTIRQAIGELENEGFVQRQQGRGTFCSYQPKLAAKKIALVTTYISEYIFPSIIRGVEDVLSSAGYTLILANTSNDKFKEAQCLENLLNQEIAGLIIEPTKSARENSNFKYFAAMQKRRIPYLMLHAVYPELDPAYILLDDEKSGYLVTQYLLQLGHREIAGIFKNDDLQGIHRQNGFWAALTDYGITPKPEWVGTFDTEHLRSFPYQFIKGLIDKEQRPTALVCYNDQIALTILEAIRETGLQVPQGISVISFDDSSLALLSEVKLTTIRHPQTEMGRQAARFIIDMVEERVEKPRLVYQPELIIRTSCAGI